MKRMSLRGPAILACGGVLFVASAAALQRSPSRALHVVQMTSRGSGPRYEPALTSVRAGDTVRFINVRGGPHNVQFFADSIEGGARAPLDSALGDTRIGPLSSRLLWDPNDAYVFVVPALPPGRYPFVCAPHYSAGMMGALVVTP
jgi:plastocyanin